MKLFEGDCLEVLKDFSDNSVDCIIADLPYGRLTSVLKWDIPIDLEKMWEELWRVSKHNSPIFLFADFKFAVHLVHSQPKYFRYEIVWVKNKSTTPLLARKRFGMSTEYILVFYKKLPPYYYLDHHKLIKKKTSKKKHRMCMGLKKKIQMKCNYEPSLPLNVVEQKGVMTRPYKETGGTYEPKLPLNVIDLETAGKKNIIEKSLAELKYVRIKDPRGPQSKIKYVPKLPVNVIDEGVSVQAKTHKNYCKSKNRIDWNPKLPVNVVEEEIENEIVQAEQIQAEQIDKHSIFKTSDCVGGSIYDGMPRLAKGRMYDPLLPLNVIKSPSVCRNKIIRNITEKPQLVLERIIKYYSKKGDVVLDFCMGSGSCGIACLNLERQFIGIEKHPLHFQKAKKRLEEHIAKIRIEEINT